MDIKLVEDNTKFVTSALKRMNESDAACLLIVAQMSDGTFHINSNLEEADLLNLLKDIKDVVTTTDAQFIDDKQIES